MRSHVFGWLPELVYTLIIHATLCTLSLAQEADSCPANASDTASIIYSPFQPWFFHYNGSNQQCWNWASCVYDQSDASRAQQFGATALVMGLIPLTFKDVAWPGRRVILLSRQPPAIIDTVVRALGLEPKWIDGDTTGENNLKVRAWWARSWLAEMTWNHSWIAIVISTIAVFVAGGGIFLIEYYSKRSSLGCVFPAFVLGWFVIALLPAWIQTLFAKIRQRRDARKTQALFGALPRRADILSTVSAVQGGEEWWIVQLAWSIYYIAGTLIYTSIMAITVIELFVWVVVSAVMTAACKMLGYFICQSFERHCRDDGQHESLLPQDRTNAQMYSRARPEAEVGCSDRDGASTTTFNIRPNDHTKGVATRVSMQAPQ